MMHRENFELNQNQMVGDRPLFILIYLSRNVSLSLIICLT